MNEVKEFDRPARQRVIVVVNFGGESGFPNDVDRAALELERAGFQVARLTDKLRATLYHPLDDFLEATIALDAGQETDDEAVDEIQEQVDDEAIDDIKEQVRDIVCPYGGDIDGWGWLEPDHVPFGFFSEPKGKDREACLPWTREEFTPDYLCEWLASRKEAGSKIGVETCEVDEKCTYVSDPYRLAGRMGNPLPKKEDLIEEAVFVRSAESRGWVREDDLPPNKRKALHDRIKREQQLRQLMPDKTRH